MSSSNQTNPRAWIGSIDTEFLFRYGVELLVETARMWADLGFFSARRGDRFVINKVTRRIRRLGRWRVDGGGVRIRRIPVARAARSFPRSWPGGAYPAGGIAGAATARGKMNSSIALAKPSSSL